MKKTILTFLAITICTIAISQTNVREYKLKTAKEKINTNGYNEGIAILDGLIQENSNDTIALIERGKAYYQYAKNHTPSSALFKKSILDLELANKLKPNSSSINFALYKTLKNYVEKCGTFSNPYNKDTLLTKEVCDTKLRESKAYLIEANRLNSKEELDFNYDQLLINIDDLITKNSL